MMLDPPVHARETVTAKQPHWATLTCCRLEGDSPDDSVAYALA